MLIDLLYGLNGSDKALSTPAFGALIDVMHEARLVRFGFGAGKGHLGAAFHARRVYVETLGLALWHCPPLDKANGTGKLRFHDSKDVATNQNLPLHVEAVPPCAKLAADAHALSGGRERRIPGSSLPIRHI